MSQVPFPHLNDAGWSPRTVFEVERNWEYITNLIDNFSTGSGGLYNAFIDADIGTSDPDSHTYPNMTELIANEPSINPSGSGHDPPVDDVFVIGVVPRQNPIVETWTGAGADNVIGKPTAIETIGYPIGDAGEHFRPRWNLSGVALVLTSHNTGAHGMNLLLRGLEVYNTGSLIADAFSDLGVTSLVFAEECSFRMIDQITPTTARITNLSSGALWMERCKVYGAQFDTEAVLFDCHLTARTQSGTGNYTITSDNLFWWGGSFSAESTTDTNDTITFSGTAKTVVVRDVIYNPDIVGLNTAGVTHTFAFSNTGTNTLEMLNARQLRVTVAAAAGITRVSGNYRSFVADASPTAMRTFSGSVQEASTWRGPGHYDIEAFEETQTFSGNGINARIRTNYTHTPHIALVGCDASLIMATVAGAGQAYTIDANSDRSILVIAGSRESTFLSPGDGGTGTTSVNSSTTTRVITHIADTAATQAADVVVDDTNFAVLSGTNAQDVFDDIDDYLTTLTAGDVLYDDTGNVYVLGADVQDALDAIETQLALMPSMVIFDTPGTFSGSSGFEKGDYPGLKGVRVRVWGAGGASGGTPSTVGGGVNQSEGGGGGGGGYAESLLPVSSLATQETVIVGAGGTPVSGGNGGIGGGSIFGFGTLTIAGGGGGGGTAGAADAAANQSNGGAGGTASGADLEITGGQGGNGRTVGGLAYRLGNGGAAAQGGGSVGVAGGAAPNAGVNGTFPGGGASGAVAADNNAAQIGGTGGGGLVIVELIY